MGPSDEGPWGTNSSAAPLLFVIGDDAETRSALVSLLLDCGHRIETYVGEVEALARMDEGILPELVVLDARTVNARRYDLERSKRPCLLDVPLVVLTTDSGGATISADAYLATPIDPERAQTIIERLLVARERNRLEEHSREIERLRALGTLVAGVAHEINNPLTFVCGNLELALRECRRLSLEAGAKEEDLARMDAAIHGARLGADRISCVVGALSRFSRSEEEELEAVDLHDVIEAACTLATGSIRSRARLVRDFGDVPLVLGNESRLGQVFLNLLVNAAQAIPDDGRDDHEIRIATGGDARSVFVEISDTGTGMPKEVARRVFEPFFTTKPAGEGTGLGLSVSHEIVAAHGGRLSVRSHPARGSTFRVELPLARARSGSGTYPSLVRTIEPPGMRTRLRIVVVDDEPLVGAVVAAALSDHDVTVYSDPREALALLARDGSDVDVVLCDATMRRLDGKTLYDSLVQRRPELASRVLFMTGSTDPAELRSLELRSRTTVLRKPFTIASLHRQIDEVVLVSHAASA